MTADGLVAWAKSKLGDGYIYGAFFDRTITESYIQQKARQYPSQYTQRYIERSRKWIGKNAGDCVGLIKGYYWLDGDRVRYLHKGRADDSARMMYNRATNKGPIATMPERPGLGVYFPSSTMCHVGVYIGNGQVIESRGVDYGVVQTTLKNRPWTNWFEVPYIKYESGGDIMRKGDKGASVGLWQKRLLEWNPKALPKYKADNSFGGETVTWTENFQRAVGLRADGVVGPATWNAMVEALKGDCAGVKAELAKAKADALTANNKLAAVRKAVDTFNKL